MLFINFYLPSKQAMLFVYVYIYSKPILQMIFSS